MYSSPHPNVAGAESMRAVFVLLYAVPDPVPEAVDQ